MSLELTPRQRSLVAIAVSILSVVVIISAVAFSAVLVVKFFRAFSHVFLPLAVAAIFAMVLEPWYGWLQNRLKLGRVLSLVVLFLSIVLPVILLLFVFGSLLVVQLGDLLQQLPAKWVEFSTWLQENRPQWEAFFRESTVGKSIAETLKSPGVILVRIGDYLASGALYAGSGVAKGVTLLMGWAVFPVYLAFFLMLPKLRPDSITAEQLPFLKPGTAEDALYLLREFFNLVVIFFRGQFVIALLQGLLFAAGFSLIGLEFGAVLGLTLGFLNIVPYLGSMIGLAICIPIAWFQAGGGVELVLLLLAVFTVVQLIEGYLLTPRIMGDRTGLPPLVIIVAIFFWGSALDGLLGMILAIPLTAFLVVVWRLIRTKYISPIF